MKSSDWKVAIVIGALLVNGAVGLNPTAAVATARGAAPMCQGRAATIVGSGVITGTPGPDVIVGSAGRDVIDARAGDDVICSGGGRDVIRAGAGDDVVHAGRGVDRVRGGQGADLLDGGRNWDSCRRGAGDTRQRCEAIVRARPNGPLVGVDVVGQPAAVVADVIATIGAPRADSGWVVGCPLDGDEANERVLEWGSLVISLERAGTTETVRSWHYRLSHSGGSAEPGGPHPAQVRLPGGVQFGTPIQDVAAALGEPLLSEVIGYYVDLDGLLLYSRISAGGGSPTDPLDGVGVPYIPLCD